MRRGLRVFPDATQIPSHLTSPSRKLSFLRFEDEIDWDDGPRDVGMVSHMHKAVMSYHQ